MVWASLVREEGSGEKTFRCCRRDPAPFAWRLCRNRHGLVSFRIKSDVDWLWMYDCGMLVIFGHELSNRSIAKKRESAIWRDCLKFGCSYLLQGSGTTKISPINLHA